MFSKVLLATDLSAASDRVVEYLKTLRALDCREVVLAHVIYVKHLADGYAEIGAGFDGAIHQAVRDTLKGCCSGCVVPCGIFKAMRVAAGLALPAPASIEIEKL